MLLQVIRTTDHQYIGLTMDIPDTFALKGQHIQVGADIYFRIDKVEQLNEHCFRFSNPSYVVLAEVIG